MKGLFPAVSGDMSLRDPGPKPAWKLQLSQSLTLTHGTLLFKCLTKIHHALMFCYLLSRRHDECFAFLNAELSHQCYTLNIDFNTLARPVLWPLKSLLKK